MPATAQAGEGDIIVRRDAGLDRAERLALRQRTGVRFAASLPLPGAELVRPEGARQQALDALNRDPDVLYAEPDRRVHAVTNDADWDVQWNLENRGQAILGRNDGTLGWQSGVEDADVDGPEAWLRSQGAGVTVAVVDSGIDASHPDLAGQVDPALGFDWVDGGEPGDPDGHGTHVAGTIAAIAENGIGIAGLAPASKLVALRVLDANGRGYASDTAAAFAYAGSRGLPIVNASLSGPYSDLVAQAIAGSPRTLFIVAAGNDGVDVADDDGAYPCRLPYANVVCVGASDNQDEPAAFSNFSSASVDLFAPGVSIWSTVPDNHYGRRERDLDGRSARRRRRGACAGRQSDRLHRPAADRTAGGRRPSGRPGRALGHRRAVERGHDGPGGRGDDAGADADPDGHSDRHRDADAHAAAGQAEGRGEADQRAGRRQASDEQEQAPDQVHADRRRDRALHGHQARREAAAGYVDPQGQAGHERGHADHPAADAPDAEERRLPARAASGGLRARHELPSRLNKDLVVPQFVAWLGSRDAH